MKKILPFLVMMVLVTGLSAQNYLSEDFSSGTMPPTGWSIDGLNAQWSINQGSEAGGTAPEAIFTWVNQTSSSRLISSPVDLTGLTSVTLMFTHFYDFYTAPAPIFGVATRHANGSWTSVWEVTPTGNVGPESIVLNITNSDVGTSDFQFSFYINGNMYNFDYWFLDDILLFTPLDLDIKLASVSLPKYVSITDTTYLEGKVKNMGSNAVTSFDVVYTINGGTPNTYSVTGVNILLGGTYDFSDPTALTFSAPGYYTLDVSVENVNGGIDADTTNNTGSGLVGVVPYKPPKKIMAEEATGTWCGWCVRGICYMDYMKATYPETWIGVAVHNGDPMVVTAYDDEIGNIIPNFPGYPSATINRAGTNYWDPSEFEEGYTKNMKVTSPATCNIVNFNYNETSRQVTFDVESEFLLDMQGEFRFGAIIVEDGLTGTTSQWAQANYYAGGSNGPMCGFEGLPNPVPAAQMEYDHVAREILGTPYGTAGSITPPINANSTHSYTFTYTLPSTWNYNKMAFVGFLLDMSNGEILNCNSVSPGVGLGELVNEHSVIVYPNPFSDNTTVAFTLDRSESITVKIYNIAGELVYSTLPKTYPSGENLVLIPGEQLSEGMYFMEMNMGSQTLTQKISVIK